MTLTSTALPAIGRALALDPAISVWIVNAYYLSAVACLLPAASLGEIHGHRRVFRAGLCIFALGAVLSALAWSLPSLICGRIVVGIGYAAMSSVTPALVRAAYPPERLGRGLGLYALVAALAVTLGPVLASGVLALASWRWIYALYLPPVLILLVGARRALPETELSGHRFDIWSALLCAGVFALALLALSSVAHGASPRGILVLGVLTLALAVILWRREADVPAPVVALDLFRHPVFAMTSLTSVCAFAVQGLAFIVLPFLLHDRMGFSQEMTGLLLLPWPLGLAVMACIAAPLADRYPSSLLAGGGLALLAGGLVLIATLGDAPEPVQIAWRLAVCGIGFGFFQTPNMRTILSSAPAGRSGGASGVVAVSRLLGQAIGAAVVALCLSLALEQPLALALLVGAALALAGSGLSLARALPGWGRS